MFQIISKRRKAMQYIFKGKQHLVPHLFLKAVGFLLAALLF